MLRLRETPNDYVGDPPMISEHDLDLLSSEEKRAMFIAVAILKRESAIRLVTQNERQNSLSDVIWQFVNALSQKFRR